MAMRAFGWIAVSVLLGAASLSSVTASDKTKTVSVSAAFTPQTSLKVSSDLLVFDIPADDGVATASVDFSAGVRTRDGGEVELTVEQVGPLSAPGGAVGGGAIVTFAGDGSGTRTGTLAPNVQSIAGRWIGSGMRRGRVVFTLRAAVPGRYSLPIRFVLSTP